MDFRKSDPYVKFHFSPNTKTSSVKRGNLNPTWTESFVFKIADLSAELPVTVCSLFTSSFTDLSVPCEAVL